MTEMTQTPAVAPVAQANASSKSLSLVERMAERLNVESGKLWATLVQTCFKPNKDGEGFTNEEVMHQRRSHAHPPHCRTAQS